MEHQKEPCGGLGDSLQCWQQHGLTTVAVDDLECSDQRGGVGTLAGPGSLMLPRRTMSLPPTYDPEHLKMRKAKTAGIGK